MRKSNRGFTLVELAIVLIIIGLILGMVFKGRHLIDSAKVKHLAAQYNKILAAVNTFYERYGYYPGDGCNRKDPPSVSVCSNPKDGILTSQQEREAFWHLLINVTHILSASDRRSVFGQDWQIWYGTSNGRSGDWLDLPGGNQADIRLVCALDQMVDDGESGSGDVQVHNNSNAYHSDSDCWSLNGQVNVVIYVLP